MGKLYFDGFLFPWFMLTKIRAPRLIMISQYRESHIIYIIEEFRSES